MQSTSIFAQSAGFSGLRFACFNAKPGTGLDRKKLHRAASAAPGPIGATDHMASRAPAVSPPRGTELDETEPRTAPLANDYSHADTERLLPVGISVRLIAPNSRGSLMGTLKQQEHRR